MATFEEKWNEFKNYLKENVPDWNTQFLNWADARGFGFGGGFFNEFPHTHTYETDLSWLISRMKWTLYRMDSVEARMKAVEDMLMEFVESLDIDQVIKDEIQRLIDNGEIGEIIKRKIIELSFITDWGTPELNLQSTGNDAAWKTNIFSRFGATDLQNRYTSTLGLSTIKLYRANQKKRLEINMSPSKMGNLSSLIDSVTNSNNYFKFAFVLESAVTMGGSETPPEFPFDGSERFGLFSESTMSVNCNWGSCLVSLGYLGSANNFGRIKTIEVIAIPTDKNRLITNKQIVIEDLDWENRPI